MTRETGVWGGLALAALLWCAASVAAGGGLMLPVLATGLCAMCAVDRPARARVLRVIGWVFSGSVWRSALIIGGALMLVQLLPAEMALLVAGDVLAYVEAVAALSLIAAHTRLRPLAAALRVRFETAVATLRDRMRQPARPPRAHRPARRPAPADDADGRGFAFA
jgi:hypothetical protein